jgi:putative flippase GtrA
MNRYVANGVAIAFVTGWNFWLNMKLSWRAADPTPAEVKREPSPP